MRRAPAGSSRSSSANRESGWTSTIPSTRHVPQNVAARAHADARLLQQAGIADRLLARAKRAARCSAPRTEIKGDTRRAADNSQMAPQPTDIARKDSQGPIPPRRVSGAASRRREPERRRSATPLAALPGPDRKAWSAAPACAQATRISSSIASGGNSWPCSVPAAREMLSFIRVPPRSLAPAFEARRRALRSHLDPGRLDVGDERMQREPRHRMHQHRFAEGRPAPRRALEIHRRFHMHEGQRHEFGEAARLRSANRAWPADAAPRTADARHGRT